MPTDGSADRDGEVSREPGPARGSGVARFALLGVVTSVVTILSSMVRSKVTAATIGPGGLGMFAEARQVFTLAMTGASIAAGPALVSRLARDLRDGRPDDAGRAVGASLIFGGALGVAGLVLGGVGYGYIVPAHTQRPALEILSLGLASVVATIAQSYVALFTAQARALSLTLQAGLSALAGVAFHVPLVIALGVRGPFFAALGASVCASAFAIFLSRGGNVRVRLGWDSAFAREALALGTTSLVTGAMSQASYTALRAALDRVGGAAEGAQFNGQFQAALTIGSQYFTMVTSGLGTYFFPRYAAARTPRELEHEVWDAADFALRAAVPVVLFMLAVRGWIIHLLYTDRFDGAVAILGYQLSGDIAKGVSWAYSGPLVFRGDLRGLLVTETVAAVLLAGFGTYAVHIVGLQGAGMAYAATYLIYLFVAAWVTSRNHGVKIKRRHLQLGALGTIAACASEYLRSFFPRIDVVLFVMAFLIAWRGGLMAMGQAAATRAFRRLIAGQRA